MFGQCYPNITGQAILPRLLNEVNMYFSGAFSSKPHNTDYDVNKYYWSAEPGARKPGVIFGFDAESNSSLYSSAISTVQPRAFQTLIIIKV